MTEEKKSINYRALFFAGIAFAGGGVVMGISLGPAIGIPLTGFGIMLQLIGLKNRDNWEQ